jgi:hypothetical protein
MPGIKHDSGKCRVDLVPPDFIEAVGWILKYGAVDKPNPDGTKGYGDNNWRNGIKYSRVYGATLRHLFSFWNGKIIDRESGRPHLHHAACNLMFLIIYEYYPELYEQFDDRFLIYSGKDITNEKA